LLVFVAIVSSAIVMQIRPSTLDTHVEAPTVRTMQVLPATCERPIDGRSALPRAARTRVWV
jgi:hypothetical protein